MSTKMTPQLRFPEFTDEWQVKKLGDVVYFRNGKAHEKSVTENGKFTIVNSKFISTSGKVRKYSDSQIEPLFSGEIVMVMSDIPNGKALAKCYYIEKSETYTLNQRICALSERSSNSNQFLIYTVNRNKYYLEFDNGVSQTNLRKDEVLACPLHIPSGTEQEKIADFLTAVDERIAVAVKKLELLETYKRGVMQKIFSQQVRFKDENGKPYPDWEEKKLGDIAKKENSPISANEIVGKSGKYKVYGASGLLQTLDSYNQSESYTAIVKDGAGVGRLMWYEAESSVLGTLNIIKPKLGGDSKYLHYLLHTINFQRYSIGSTIPHVYFSDYSKHKLVVPESIKEQQKIANFLTTLDEKITAEKSKLTATKQFKKALLQRMFV